MWIILINNNYISGGDAYLLRFFLVCFLKLLIAIYYNDRAPRNEIV